MKVVFITRNSFFEEFRNNEASFEGKAD